MERGQEYPLEGFGVMKPGPNGTIAFTHEPGAAAPLSGDEKPARQSQLEPGKLAEAVRTAFAEPHVSPSAKMNPDPSVRGLRYGKPPRIPMPAAMSTVSRGGAGPTGSSG